MNQLIWFAIGFAVTLAIVSFADAMEGGFHLLK